MAKLDIDHIKELVELFEKKIFPVYAESLSAEQAEILTFLNQQNLTKDQIIAGLIQGMAHASFQLAVKLSFLLASAMNNPDFDFHNPKDLQEIISIFGEPPAEPKKGTIISLN